MKLVTYQKNVLKTLFLTQISWETSSIFRCRGNEGASHSPPSNFLRNQSHPPPLFWGNVIGVEGVKVHHQNIHTIILAHPQITYRATRVLQDMHLLQAFFEGIFTTRCTIEGPHQEGIFHMVRGSESIAQYNDEGDEHFQNSRNHLY